MYVLRVPAPKFTASVPTLLEHQVVTSLHRLPWSSRRKIQNWKILPSRRHIGTFSRDHLRANASHREGGGALIESKAT